MACRSLVRLTMAYTEEEMLMLSGIQHYVFCPRQWALIHLEQQWEENRLTAEGQLLHQNVDNPAYRQLNGSTLTLRRVAIASRELGLSGFSDAVELQPSESDADTITHSRYPGRWKPVPVEYKRGRAKLDRRDEVQVAAQAMCLEEMYGIRIPHGALYYGEERHRTIVAVDEELRLFTRECAESMHRIFSTGLTPRAQLKPHCRSCSLQNLCMPALCERGSVRNYLKKELYEETS